MIEVVTDEHSETITSLFKEAKKEIKIISPFLSNKTADFLCEAANKGIACSFITRFYLQDFLDGSNTLDGLQSMLDSGVKLYAVIGLHTKLYLFDEDDAIVGSANFTESGLSRNIELSIHFNEEAAIEDLQEYFDDISTRVNVAEDGCITQEMLDDFKLRYQNQKESKSKLDGGKHIVALVKGAALDKRAKQIKEDINEAFREIDNNTSERLTDPVYSALGGETSIVSHKSLRNIILKFSASAKKRANGDEPMYMHAFVDNGKSVYISNFSVTRLKSAKTIEEGDETFFCVHSYDKTGKECPVIVGKGYFRAFSSNNDARKKAWIKQYDWLEEYPIYCVISEAKVIDAPVNCGIPLREVIDNLGYKTYMHTRDNPDKYPKERVAKAHGQQAMLALSPEAKEYIDERLETLGMQYGWKIYKSE
ncbi:PLD-like domain-containing protein [Pseudobutyrivibrio sp. 49]|uniref:phospholipase D family protein n=1 Tax=Pseudobutyrivibrio sp. 49 TaxID=1855344 RepID=UPI000891DD71|nr:phospholipase D family protein [Pseudobutyrivibrio sp. 49]SDH83702.1 PLD-like domain-containing protein [Pseudobutyrivibrio sp. 49]